MPTELYAFKEGVLSVIDSELGLAFQEAFNPILIPPTRIEGKKLRENHFLRVVKQGDLVDHIYVEKNEKMEGHYLSFYPGGALKMEAYYLEGNLHGPSAFFSEEGILLAKNWFIFGKREGKSQWHYPSGKIYSHQSFFKGVWHGKQLYYYPDGQLKTKMHYLQGELEGEVILYNPDGSVKRVLK